MKDLFSKWLLAFTVFAAVGFISCGSDDDDVTPPDEDMEVEADDYSMPSQLIVGQRTTSFSYNPDGTVSEIKEDDGDGHVYCYRYDYSKLESDHIITVKQYGIQNGEESEYDEWYEYILEDGRVVACRVLDDEGNLSNEETYTYNEKGQLISYKPQENFEIRITWENDVITNVDTKYGEGDWFSRTQSIEYSKVKVGRYGGYFDLAMKYLVLDDEEAGLLLNGMFGAKVKYFPKKMLGDNTVPDGSLEFSSKTSAIPSSITFQGVKLQIMWMSKAMKKKGIDVI